MAIKVGDKLPQATFRVMTADGPVAKTSDELFKGRKIVLFAVPGAFTPTCSMNHLPGFLENRDSFYAKGVNEIAVIAVNDHHVMQAWAKASGGEGKIRFLADGSANLTRALGLEADMSAGGMGRSVMSRGRSHFSSCPSRGCGKPCQTRQTNSGISRWNSG